MIMIREAVKDDIIEIAYLLYDAMLELYPSRSKKSILVSQFVVSNWIAVNDVYVTYNTSRNNEITGFIVGHKNSFSNLLNEYYTVLLVYVKPEYRITSRSAKLLYNKMVEIADSAKLPIEITAISAMSERLAERFAGKSNGTVYIRNVNGKT